MSCRSLYPNRALARKAARKWLARRMPSRVPREGLAGGWVVIRIDTDAYIWHLTPEHSML